jgi:hypothetical protein
MSAELKTMTFPVTYTIDATGTILELAPTGATFTVDDGIDEIEIVNNAGSDITIEGTPYACNVFEKPGKFMDFKIKNGQSERFRLRWDLAGAFVSGDFVSLQWRARSKSGAQDMTPLNPGSLFDFQIQITKT